MTEENCEKSCPCFIALMHIDPPVALRSREAREETQRGEESFGSAGTMCGSCAMVKRNRAASEKGQREFLASK